MEQLIEELKQDFYIAFFETTTEGVYNGELISLTENKGTAIRRTAELLHENAAYFLLHFIGTSICSCFSLLSKEDLVISSPGSRDNSFADI